MNQVEFVFGRSPEWIGSFPPTKWTRSPFRMLLRSGSSREENKMLLPLPLSFFALLIFPFPSNGGRAAAGAGGKNLREDALRSFFFQCNIGKRPLFVISAAFQILYWTHGVARTFKSCLSLCSNKTHPPGWKECPPSSDKVSTSPGKARRREGDTAGEGKGFRRSRDFLSWPRMAYGACYLKGARFFDRGAMIAGASPRSARWPIGIAACGLCLPIRI